MESLDIFKTVSSRPAPRHLPQDSRENEKYLPISDTIEHVNYEEHTQVI